MIGDMLSVVVVGGIAAIALFILLVLYTFLRIVKTLVGKIPLSNKTNFVLIIFVSGLVYGLFVVAPSALDSQLNKVLSNQQKYLPIPSKEAEELHKSLWISDLHSDTLLWPKRDINQRTDGHVDVPRLLEGNVALQSFTIVTSSPALLNFESNPEPGLFDDSLTYKSLIEFWGVDSITSLAARTLFQVNNFHKAVNASEGRLHAITSQATLKKYVDLRKTNNITAGFIGIEGMHALDGKIENIDVFYNAGVRMMAPTHFFDNDIGGSAQGVHKYGLTMFGKQALTKMQAKNMIVDVAHASEKVIDDVLQLAKKPIVSSHTGVKGVCNNQRNLSDKHLRGIARTKGLIGVAYFEPAQCGENLLASIVNTIKYIRSEIGVEYIALGSDYDGTVEVPFDTSGLIYLTEALLLADFTPEEIRLIMGGNVLRFLQQVLPAV